MADAPTRESRIPALLLLLWLLVALGIAVAATGCTRIEIAQPQVKAGQLGGRLAYSDGQTSVTIDNEASFADAAKAVRGLVTTVAALDAAKSWIDAERAKDAANAGIEQARIGAETQRQATAAAAELDLLKESNRAAEALAAP